MSPIDLYDSFAKDYDRFVSWGGRLAHEMPFFETLFAENSVETVLDSACGTGHHAVALAQRGYRVTGADASEQMVEQAIGNVLSAGLSVPFVAAGFGEMRASVDGLFDALLCLGNSLPHVLTADALREALADMAGLLRPGGLLVVQNRNFDRVWARRERFMGPQAHREADREWVFVRFYDYGEETITFNVVTLLRDEHGEWHQTVDATSLRPIFQVELKRLLVEVGFDKIDFYGNYLKEPFDPEHSGDLVVVASKQE